MRPPPRLKYQKAVGITLRRARSEASHWRKKRPKKSAWPKKPMAIRSWRRWARQLLHGGDGDPAPLQPPDSEEIGDAAPEAVADPVLALAEAAGAVVHRQ